MLHVMRHICNLDRKNSLIAMLNCIDIIERNFRLDDNICNGEYQTLCYYLDGLYKDVIKELDREED